MAMGKIDDGAPELKTIKSQMLLSQSEAKKIDDWMFSNRLKSRAQAIRLLVKAGLECTGTQDEE